MQTLKENKVIIFILFVFIIEAILFSAGNFKLERALSEKEKEYKKLEQALGELDTVAFAVSVKDLTLDRKLFGKNDNFPLPLASLVKTMTVLVALDDYQEQEIINIKEEAIKEQGDFGLFANEKWKIEDLAKLTLLTSANDGIIALVKDNDEVLSEMNAKAKRLGMNSTYFFNSTGLDMENRVGAVGSADDMNTLSGFALMSRPGIFKATVNSNLSLTSESGFVHEVKNTNTIVDKIPNLLFSKTGYTEISGGNLSIIFKNKNGHNIAITVLGSTFEDRFYDMEKLVNVLDNFQFIY